MPSDLHEDLLRLTIALGAESGLERLSLRQIATAAGVSTTAIFQNFAGKAELFAAAVTQAIALDEEFHRRLAEETFALVSGHEGLADLMATYIELRATRSEARFLSEMLVNLQEHPECLEALRGWHVARVAQWQTLLARLDIAPAFAPLLAGYLLMEGLYAHALRDSAAYRMLLAETCRAQCDAAFHGDATGNGPSGISLALDVQPFAVGPPVQSDTKLPVAEHLLATAVAIVNESGMRKLNQRALASRAGVSGSLIAYHFGDMKSLTIQAIWRALVQGIPSQLDPAGDSSSFPRSLEEWFDVLEAMLALGGEAPRGFYIGVSQLSARACLLACHNPELMPLITYLRGLEGWGTYRVSQTLPRAAGRVRRDHAAAFGIWIKSEALLRDLGIWQGPASFQPVSLAAGMLFPVNR